MSMMRSLITSEVMGSRPVVGSSYRIISGFRAITRARPRRFFMPPESSLGIFTRKSGFRLIM
jgi:hypothetical protein